jgi:predicted dehydrogenase
VFSTSGTDSNSWRAARCSGGGVLLDLASHHVDLIHFLFAQDVVEVSANIGSHRTEGDTAAVQLRLQDGLLVDSFFSLCSVEENRVEVYGDAGRLNVDHNLSVDREIRPPGASQARLRHVASALSFLRRPGYIVRKMRAAGHDVSYQAALAHFIDAIREQRTASPDLWDGYRALAVIEAAEESARSGMMVAPRARSTRGAAI